MRDQWFTLCPDIFEGPIGHLSGHVECVVGYMSLELRGSLNSRVSFAFCYNHISGSKHNERVSFTHSFRKLSLT